jgi:hypothetical protein
MARLPPSTPSNGPVASASGFPQFQESGSSWDTLGSQRRSIPASSSSIAGINEPSTYLMPTSPAKGRRGSADYRPSIKKTVGNIPACLVNASVTYCGNDQIYAFGGFDQYTDEGTFHILKRH